MMPDPIIPTISAHGPYEDLAIELIKLIREIIQDQPKEVKAELWKLYLEDVKAWREFWKSIK